MPAIVQSPLGSAQRDVLLDRYRSRLGVNPELDRSIVSFQANRRQPFYGWFKFKEGFSSNLVAFALDRYLPHPGVVLDPFAGIGTTLFAARSMGHRVLGIELMPLGPRAVEAASPLNGCPAAPCSASRCR